jgi:hypothetical protein
MNVSEAILTRKSIRAYWDKPVLAGLSPSLNLVGNGSKSTAVMTIPHERTIAYGTINRVESTLWQDL